MSWATRSCARENLPEQRGVRVHATAVAQKHAEQAELAGPEMELPAVPMDGAPREVDGERAFNLDPLVPGVGSSPPQRGAHPCHKLVRRERLGHVVVRAGGARAPCARRRHRRGSAASAQCAPAPVGRTADVGAHAVDVDRDVILCDGSTAR
jgi:hypothetical protein